MILFSKINVKKNPTRRKPLVAVKITKERRRVISDNLNLPLTKLNWLQRQVKGKKYKENLKARCVWQSRTKCKSDFVTAVKRHDSGSPLGVSLTDTGKLSVLS